MVIFSCVFTGLSVVNGHNDDKGSEFQLQTSFDENTPLTQKGTYILDVLTYRILIFQNGEKENMPTSS